MNNRKEIYLAIILFTTVAGCSEELNPNIEAAREHQTTGWLAYDRNDFSAALLSFERAVNLNSELTDAHNGLGWSHLSMSRVSAVNPQIVSKAKESFEDAIRIDSSNADAWVGLANTLFLRRRDNSDFQATLLALENAFDANHRFLFRHDYRSAADLHALKAACYFYLGKNDLAKASVQTVIGVDSQNPTALSLKGLLD
ncbi:MAG: tetratricopeptide repeat protein [Candidatus Poribacteria bacterium]|nr:tetratricopeptide repeat protein [Candidatus Poribacteria bacterium]